MMTIGKYFLPRVFLGRIHTGDPIINYRFSSESWSSSNDYTQSRPITIFLITMVYDVSSYLDEHPGGDDVILETAGKDATDGFEDAGHNQDARELLETMCIGEVDPSPASVISKLEIYSKKQDYALKLKIFHFLITEHGPWLEEDNNRWIKNQRIR